MSSLITLSSAFASALVQHTGTSVIDQLGGGTLKLYDATGGTPTGANESITTQVLLATWTLGPSSGAGDLTNSGGVITLAFSNATVTAAATGTATFFRISNSSAAALIQGLVGTSGSDWNLSSVAITSGDNVSITGTPTLTLPVT